MSSSEPENRVLPKNEAMRIVAFFLAQPEPTHTLLGFELQSQAIDKLAAKLDVKPNTLRNTRDAFDRYTESSRIGWDGKLSSDNQSILSTYGGYSKEDLCRLVKGILEKRWTSKLKGESIFSLFPLSNDPKEQVDFEANSNVVTFFNSGGKGFLLTVPRIKRSLEDILQNIDKFQKAGDSYKETEWRLAFETALTDEVAKPLAAVQSLPFFELLAKIVHYTNFEESKKAKFFPLEKVYLEKAIQELNSIEADTKQQGRYNTGSTEAIETGGENRIYYGAPGTGKSHAIEQLINDHLYVRTVFHADVQNSDFVGALKPSMESGSVSYSFSPGPFAMALQLAHTKPAEHIYLVIEELNRAPAASVFGDIFLLLDRDENGRSVYDISFPSPEFRAWYEEITGRQDSQMFIPSNLSLLATMNGADQGVYPLDTAFKRRWIQEYVEIDYSQGPDVSLQIHNFENEAFELAWQDFAKVTNDVLVQNFGMQEDRLIGPWFISANEVSSAKNIPDKVLIYLWDDLLRHKGRDEIFDTDNFNTFGSLAKAGKAGKRIFSTGFLQKLRDINLGHV